MSRKVSETTRDDIGYVILRGVEKDGHPGLILAVTFLPLCNQILTKLDGVYF